LAAGGAVHRALESWDLEADPQAELARQRALLPSYLAALLGDARPTAPSAAPPPSWTASAAGPLLPRLCSLAAGVLARELPVLLPPGPRETAPVGYVAGAIDLFYEDRDGALVVADYKTDDVQAKRRSPPAPPPIARRAPAYVQAVQEALGLAGAAAVRAVVPGGRRVVAA